jgi:hypothetical protein
MLHFRPIVELAQSYKSVYTIMGLLCGLGFVLLIGPRDTACYS